MPMNGRWAGRRLKPLKPRTRKRPKKRSAKVGLLGPPKKRATKIGVPKRRWSGQRVSIRSRANVDKGDKPADFAVQAADGPTSKARPDGRRPGPAMPPWISGYEAANIIHGKPPSAAKRQALQPSNPPRAAKRQALQPSNRRRKVPG